MQPVLRAVSTPRRREFLRLIWNRESSAGGIHRALDDVTFGAVSQHLKQLENAGLVTVRRQGRSRLYSARRAALGSLRTWLESMWEDALYRLHLNVELEAARRGPRSKTRTQLKSRRSNRRKQ